ncbi:MAG: YHS domain-containing (seleno)protein [Pseudomonadota bacterium]
MKTTLIAAAFALSFNPAFAGPQYIDDTGFAVSGFDVVAYFALEQSSVGKPQPPAVPGKASITADYNGSTFAFSTEENKAAFLADPAKYAPQFDGHCAYGVSVGGKVPANPNLWRIVDGKLYLNITEDVVYLWEEDVPGHINKAGNKWTRLESKRASRRSIPSYSSTAPLQN